MICFFDTETTGLPNKKLPPDHESQPYIQQLALSLYDEDRRPVFELSTLVQLPAGVEPGPEALATHGITVQMCDTYGTSMSRADILIRWAFSRSKLVVAHNLQFDEKLINYQSRRLANAHSPFEGVKAYCTMEGSTPIIALPPTPKMIQFNMGKYKAPKLSEAYEFFFDEELSGAHDALVDTRACARVYYHMLDNGMI